MSAATGGRSGRWLVCAMAVAALAGLGGCASPASRGSMAVQEVALVKHHPYSVTVSAQGGTETGALDSSNIANADLKAALEDSIRNARLFSSVVQGKGGDYELTVIVTRLDKPLFGASFAVELDAGWSLVRVADRTVVMRKAIKSSHTATMGDAFAGVTRLRLAVEGAARANIEQGMKAIAALDL